MREQTSTKIRVKKFFITIYALDQDEEILREDGQVVKYVSRYKIDGDSTVVIGRKQKDAFILEVRAKGKTERISFTKDQYDYSSNDSPEAEFTYQGQQATFRILDLEAVQVIRQTLQWAGSEDLTLGAETVPCRVIEFKSSQGEGKRWVTDDEFMLLVKEEGRDADGPYKVVLSAGE